MVRESARQDEDLNTIVRRIDRSVLSLERTIVRGVQGRRDSEVSFGDDELDTGTAGFDARVEMLRKDMVIQSFYICKIFIYLFVCVCVCVMHFKKKTQTQIQI